MQEVQIRKPGLALLSFSASDISNLTEDSSPVVFSARHNSPVSDGIQFACVRGKLPCFGPSLLFC